MSLEWRTEVFGNPSEALVQEAVFLFKEDYGDWPLLEEIVEEMTEWLSITEEEATDRILAAIRDGDVEPQVRAGMAAWGAALNQKDYDRLKRMQMDRAMKRADAKERF